MKVRFRIYGIPILVWLTFLALFIRSYQVDRGYERRQLLATAAEEARLRAGKLAAYFHERTADLNFIVRTMTEQGGGRSTFAVTSRQIHRNHPVYQAIAWFSPLGKPVWIVPTVGNEQLGMPGGASHDVIMEALSAADSVTGACLSEVWQADGNERRVAIAIPFRSQEPRRDADPEGFVVGVLRLDPIIHMTLAEEDTLALLFELTDNGKTFWTTERSSVWHSYAVTLPISVANRVWRFKVIPSAQYLKATSHAGKHVVPLAAELFASTVLSFLLGLFLHRREQLLAALQEKVETEALQEKVVSNAYEGIAISHRGIIRYVNPAYLRMFGYDHPTELIGQSNLILAAPEEHERLRTYIQNRHRGAQAPSEYSFVGRRKDGSRFHVEITVSTLELHGEIQTLGFFRDVTERIRTEERQRFYQRLFTNAGEGIVISDCDGIIREVNPAFARMTGCEPAECEGKPLKSYRLDNESSEPMDHILLRVIHQGGYSGEAAYRRKDGSVVAVLNSFDAIRDEQGKVTHVLGLCLDLTERKSLEAQLLQAQKMESVGTLAGGIAHDFNNLLTGILGYSSLLLTTLPEEAAGRSEIEAIEKTALRAADLTKRLLAFSRKAPVDFQPLNLNEVVQDTVQFLRRSLSKGIEVDVQCDPQLHLVQADLGQVQQALLNLCVNAGDAMPEGGRLVIETQNIDIDTRVTRHSSQARSGRFVVLAVTDTGVGMTPDEEGRIFEPFFTTKEVGKGTGLGLAMVYGIVQSHKGWVDVFSEVGVGSTFKVYLPAAEEGETPRYPSRPPVVRGDETILVVDDEPIVLDLAVGLLEVHGYTIFTAADSEEALRMLSAHSGEIDLIILDLQMPRMSGKNLFVQIRRLYPEIKVLISSGWASNRSELEDLLTQGASGFVQKPYQVHQLARAVREAFGKEEAFSSR